MKKELKSTIEMIGIGSEYDLLDLTNDITTLTGSCPLDDVSEEIHLENQSITACFDNEVMINIDFEIIDNTPNDLLETVVKITNIEEI